MDHLHEILGLATLLPLFSFAVILVLGGRMTKPIAAGWIALSAIVGAAACSFVCLALWCGTHFPEKVDHHGHAHSAVPASDGQPAAGPALHLVRFTGLDEPAATAPAAHAPPAAAAATGDEPGHATPHAGEAHPGEAAAEGEAHGHKAPHDDHDGHANPPPPHVTGDYWTLGKFGQLEVTISYYIDGLTILMFCMVTFIASCIHIYAMGYMHDEEHDVTDHEVTLSDGHHLHRPGRFPRFFQYLSLFCFSMLGLVLAGNIAMVFVFWELVGICSYFLIGFYVERKSASNAANKAFIVNRVGDFGFIIGLLALWSSLGTFAFGDLPDASGVKRPGIFSQLRPEETGYALRTPDSMVLSAARSEVATVLRNLGPNPSQEVIDAAIAERLPQWRAKHGWLGVPYGYWLLIVAGVGIFCGCVGKSAQFPLHVWLPDAMEGPTPVSALVHSATMVAAGVYLVGRFYPVFTPEVLWVIALTGCITLFLAATIAITATDIKRVLAYSTVSQLGYMMLALGVGGWIAGMMHLITHAFFKSLLFMCSGSVIHAVHTNEMTAMGGLRKKMPITAYTMLVGCLAIAGAGVPFLVGFSGYYSKDKILEQAFSFMQTNGGGWGAVFFTFAAGGAAITAFYMFRMWYLTFAGQPRDHHRYDHAHESPPQMWGPLVVLAVLALGVAWQPTDAFRFAGVAAVVWIALLLRWATTGGERQRSVLRLLGGFIVAVAAVGAIWSLKPLVLENLLEQARPVGTLPTAAAVMSTAVWPSEPLSHDYVVPITLLAFGTAAAGFVLATLMYGLGVLSPDEVRKQFAAIYVFLRNKWWFDELYDFVFVRPTHVVSRLMAGIDKQWIDGFIDGTAAVTKTLSRWWDQLADRTIVDGLVNLSAQWTHSIGLGLRALQTGRLRQYVMFIVIGTISIFVLLSFFWNPTLAG